jgi:hypothetical protein
MARNSFLLQQGRNVADVAYFYGEEAPLTGLFGDAPVADAPVHYAYDFINADALTSLISIDNGRLVTRGGASYRVLYLGGSSRYMTLATLQRIAALVEAGATVVGEAPLASPSLQDDPEAYRQLLARLWPGGPDTSVGKGHVIASHDIETTLARLGLDPDFGYRGASSNDAVLFVHRHMDEGDAYFLDNRQDHALHVEGQFRVTGRVPELWHADSGRIEPLAYRTEGTTTIVPLDFGPDESAFVVFRKATQDRSRDVRKPTLTKLAAINGPWTVSFQPGRGAPDHISLPALISLSQNDDDSDVSR